MVKPGGTGTPAFVISARPAPLPPSTSFMFPCPSACPSPKKYTYVSDPASPETACPCLSTKVSLSVVLMTSLLPLPRPSFHSADLSAHDDRPLEQHGIHWPVDDETAEHRAGDLLAVQLARLASRPPHSFNLSELRPLAPVAPRPLRRGLHLHGDHAVRGRVQRQPHAAVGARGELELVARHAVHPTAAGE